MQNITVSSAKNCQKWQEITVKFYLCINRLLSEMACHRNRYRYRYRYCTDSVKQYIDIKMKGRLGRTNYYKRRFFLKKGNYLLHNKTQQFGKHI
jgi:hypothetical protein